MLVGKVAGRVILSVALMVIVLGMGLTAPPAHNTTAFAPTQEPLAAEDHSVATALDTWRIYLPLVARDYGPRSSRLGFCAIANVISNYKEVKNLAAGWYLRFATDPEAPQPSGMDHVQVVRIHQLTTCWPQRVRDRAVCPYVNPHTYVINSPGGGMAEIAQIAHDNPGTMWFIGNEMDRRDWDGGGQDEMLPELYARAYHEIRQAIKTADPTAQVAIGGMVQATPLRLEYLNKVWGAYTARYGTTMPVDVWNVHNFIFREYWMEYGADIPPGSNAGVGAEYLDAQQNDMTVFRTQIQYFRQWMKDHGQQQKPLIVSEYGIVYRHANLNRLSVVQNFMLQTFDYFMNTKDCSLGYAADECRLVQRWAWYSLDDNDPLFNDYAYLIDPKTGFLTATGQTFAAYAQQHLDVR